MTQLQKKLHLDDQALKRIAQAVQDAETHTTGEIALAAIKESSRYSFWELFWSVVFAAFVFSVILPAAGHITQLLDGHIWNVAYWYIPAFYGITSFGIIAVGFCLANIPCIDRIVVPRRVRHVCVYNRAMRYFAESGVYQTAEHSGILIFISWLEREVRIIADSGINAKISPDMWKLIADDIADGMSKKNTEQAIIGAIQKCGDLLTQFFPAQQENPDELPNGLMLLEHGEWN